MTYAFTLALLGTMSLTDTFIWMGVGSYVLASQKSPFTPECLDRIKREDILETFLVIQNKYVDHDPLRRNSIKVNKNIIFHI